MVTRRHHPWPPELLLLTLLLFTAAPVPGWAEPAAEGPATQAAKTVLVLSGGGARGAAHVGVIRALEELRIPVDAVVGTSMGAVVGALYAAGHSPAQLERILARIDWQELLTDTIPRPAARFRNKQEDAALVRQAASGISLADGIKLPKGAVQGHKLRQFLRRNTLHIQGPDQFADLPLPYRAIATDLATGGPVVLDRGDLTRAVFASFAIPTLVEPIEIDGHLLIDGGVSNNLGIDVARRLWSDVPVRVIAVDVSSPLRPTREIDSVVAVTDQLTSILTRQNTDAQLATLGAGDVLIVPDLDGFSAVGFERSLEAVTLGYDATQAQSAALAAFATDRTRLERWQASHRREPRTAIAVRSLAVRGDADRLSEAVLRDAALDTGIVAVDDIEAMADRIYNADRFSTVSYHLEDDQLVIEPVPKSWGPAYLQFGLQLQGDFAGRSEHNLGVALTLTELNAAGAEWRTEVNLGSRPRLHSEFLQPFGKRGGWFVAPVVEARGFNFGQYEGNREVVRYRVRQALGGLDLGYTLEPAAQLRVGVRSGTGRLAPLTGDRSFAKRDADLGYGYVRFIYDTLDDLYFPTTGQKLMAQWTSAEGALGAVSDFRAWEVDLQVANSWGNHNLLATASAARVYDGVSSLNEQFFLGGFLNLSGVELDRFSGQQRALTKLVYSYRWADSPIVPAYVGFSAEAGGVFGRREDPDLGDLNGAGSLFLGFDSPLGPIYAAAGFAEGGRRIAYLLLGRPL